MTDRVAAELSRARQRLLDLTLRNRLLNFRPSRRTTVAIVDESPAEVWKLLVDRGKELAFLCASEQELLTPPEDPEQVAEQASEEPISEEQPTEENPSEEHPTADEASEQSPRNSCVGVDDASAPDNGDTFTQPTLGAGEIPARYTDLFLQTPLTDEALQTSLLRIEQQARSAIEERGVNLLFLAMGFLDWQPEGRKELVRAPLLLLPVALKRTTARHRFKLRALEDEPILNPCLRRKLLDFQVALPDEPASWEEFDLAPFLAETAKAVEGLEGWQVTPDIYLGFFSFTKYLMYADLDPANWPADRELLANPLIAAVAGGDREAGLGGGNGDRHHQTAAAPVPISDVAIDFQVLDADSSQQEAIRAVKAGGSLVIEGPPGTGKSQTIANLIAECLGNGRTVLFVSEKLAALEVVQRRLAVVGLGDFCLELHSTKANRSSVVRALEAVLRKGRYDLSKPPDGERKLQRLREGLDDYVLALHEPWGKLAASPYHAFGRSALLADVPDVAADVPGLDAVDAPGLEQAQERLTRLGRHMSAVWPVTTSPWRGAKITEADAAAEDRVGELIAAADKALTVLREAYGQLAEMLGAPTEEPPVSSPGANGSGQTPQPVSMATVDRLGGRAAMVMRSPDPPRELLEDAAWADPPGELAAVLTKLGLLSAAIEWMKGRYDPASLHQADWSGMLQRVTSYWDSPFRVLRPAWWSDRKRLKRCRLPEHRPQLGEQVEDLRKLAQAQTLHEELAGSAAVAGRHFGPLWQGEFTDFPALHAVAGWLTQFAAVRKAGEIGPQAVELARQGADRSALQAAAEALAEKRSRWRDTLVVLRDAIRWDPAEAFAPADDERDVPLADIADRLAAMGEGLNRLIDWSRYRQALEPCQSGPTGPFVASAVADELAPELLSLAFERRFWQLWLAGILRDRPALGSFDATDHEANLVDFARADRAWVNATARRLHGELASRRPDAQMDAARSSQLGIVQGEIRRKRGGRSIRKLLGDAAQAIAKLKPCFLMSPLSVAQFLAADGMRFDVVVFDEASQVEPADALGAVARAGQLVLVGDPRQLPPTAFFDSVSGESDAAAAPEDEQGEASLADMESILDRGAVVLPVRRLKWHYRSRHESLIAYSNHEFYEGELVVFPSAWAGEADFGLHLRMEADDLYDRGRTGTNRAQARRVAAAVFEHAKATPEVSLGIGAFSVAQQQVILDEVEHLRRANDSVEAFFDPERPEPFFVKNLETIQGDERDVIFLSVGYGRHEAAARLSMNFGPLNQQGGWRRLNVLITRARRRCEVFTSVAGEDFDLSATAARGVHALKGYLDYARSGELPGAAAAAAKAELGPFEQAVYNALTERGVKLRPRVGVAGCRIDLAVLDEDHPGRYLMGIDCDGAWYRDAAGATDRDRLRYQVLEGLGWRVHRVWSAQWHRSPQREIDRALAAIDTARRGQLKPRFLPPPPRGGGPVPDADGPPAGFAPIVEGLDIRPYEYYSEPAGRSAEDFYAAPVEALAELLTAIVRVEGPIHRQELARRLAGQFGLTRLGSRIEEKIDSARARAEQAGRVVPRGDFAWPAGMDDPPVRRRDQQAGRDIELICPEEIARAASLLLAAQMGMARDDLVGQVAGALGFQAAGHKIQARVDDVVQAELAAGRLVEDGETIRLSTPV